MNSHNKVGRTCLFNNYTDGGYCMILWQVRVISSANAIYISVVL